MKIIVRKCRDQIAVVAVMVYSKLDDNDKRFLHNSDDYN